MDFKIAVRSSDEDGESERQTLLDLLEHTQALLKTSQDSAAKERQNQSEQYRLLELRLTNQLRLVKEENASLKEEMERVNKTHGLDGMSLKGYMLKEIEKIEHRAAEREAELLGQVESSRNEVHIYKSHLETRAKSLADDRAQIQKELEQARLEAKRIHTYYSTQLQDLKTELSATANHFKKATEDVRSARAEIAAKESVEVGKRAQLQATWDTEKESLQTTIKRLQKTISEKDKLVAELSSATETDIKAEITPLKAQNETLSFDKLALKQQLQMAASLYVKKEKNLQQQLDKYKRLSEQLKERRASTGSDYAPDSGRLYALLMTLEEYDRQIREVIGKVAGYTEALTREIEKSEDREQEKEQGQGKRLDDLIGKIGALQAFPDLEALAGLVNDQAKAYETALNDLKARISEAITGLSGSFTAEINQMKSQSDEILSLRSENQALQSQIDLLTANLKEKMDLQADLDQSEQELEHAKATILNYMESISALEEVIAKGKVEGGESEEGRAEVEKLNIEVTRLTQENADLSTVKAKAEETFEASIAKVKESLEAKNKENATLKTKFAQEKTRANERIQAFSTKLDDAKTALQETSEELKAETAHLLQALPPTVQLQQAWSDLQRETFNALKAQVKEREALLEETRAKWKEEVEGLGSAEPAWTDMLEKAESQTEALAELNKTLGSMLHTLTQLAETLNSQAEQQRAPGSMGVEEEVESLRAQLATKQQEYEEEINLVRSRAEAEVRSVKNIEAALTAEIAALRTKIRDLKTVR